MAKEAGKVVQKAGWNGRYWGYIDRKAVMAEAVPPVEHEGYVPVWATRMASIMHSGTIHAWVNGMAGVVPRWIVGDPVQRPPVVAQLDEDLVWVHLKGGEWTVAHGKQGLVVWQEGGRLFRWGSGWDPDLTVPTWWNGERDPRAGWAVEHLERLVRWHREESPGILGFGPQTELVFPLDWDWPQRGPDGPRG